MNTSRPTWEAKPFLTRQELLLLLSVALFGLAIILVVAIYLLVSGSQGVPVEETLPVTEEPVQVMLDQTEPIVLETSGYTWVMTPRATFAKAIPFITVSGVGPHEAGWTMGFRLIGYGFR
ncbi:MAG: hypothetical protein KA314_14915 [Chloroflexi bacterium]|nr:hypothetical protein [Chloroflexota bacterium]MBP8057126.1 hypothetical protein [Chloroflexota bacterium]